MQINPAPTDIVAAPTPMQAVAIKYSQSSKSMSSTRDKAAILAFVDGGAVWLCQ